MVRVENADCIIFSSVTKDFRFTSIYSKKDRRIICNAKRFYEDKKYNLILPALTSVGDGYFIGFINSLYLKQYLVGKSALDKYTNADYSTFLVVKVKFKGKI